MSATDALWDLGFANQDENKLKDVGWMWGIDSIQEFFHFYPTCLRRVSGPNVDQYNRRLVSRIHFRRWRRSLGASLSEPSWSLSAFHTLENVISKVELLRAIKWVQIDCWIHPGTLNLSSASSFFITHRKTRLHTHGFKMRKKLLSRGSVQAEKYKAMEGYKNLHFIGKRNGLPQTVLKTGNRPLKWLKF